MEVCGSPLRLCRLAWILGSKDQDLKHIPMFMYMSMQNYDPLVKTDYISQSNVNCLTNCNIVLMSVKIDDLANAFWKS